MPIDKMENPDGTLTVRLDPVSYGAMMASVGHLFPLDQIIAELERINLQSQLPPEGQEEFDNSIPDDDPPPEDDAFSEDDALQLPD